MARVDRILGRFTFGGRVPGGVGIVLTVTILTSLVAAFGSRNVASLVGLAALVPERVLHGEVWRLITWSVIEPSPMKLLFACLLLYWFGKDLTDQWGSRRFLGVYFGIAMVASVGTCLLSLVDKDLLAEEYLGSWPLAQAITIAWGLWFPQRTVRLYFVIPIKGVVIAWGTVALTIAYAVFKGWAHFVPSLLAEGSMLAWLYRAPLVTRWSRWKRMRETAGRQQRARKRSVERVATVHVLHALEEKDDDLPPLPPEVEGQIGRIFEDAARAQRKKRDQD